MTTFKVATPAQHRRSKVLSILGNIGQRDSISRVNSGFNRNWLSTNSQHLWIWKLANWYTSNFILFKIKRTQSTSSVKRWSFSWQNELNFIGRALLLFSLFIWILFLNTAIAFSETFRFGLGFRLTSTSTFGGRGGRAGEGIVTFNCLTFSFSLTSRDCRCCPFRLDLDGGGAWGWAMGRGKG